MVDAAPSDVGDVQQPVDAAQINERTVIGDVLDHAFQNLAFPQVGHKLRPGLGTALFQHGAARHDNVAARPVHFQDLERLRGVHQRGDVTDRTNVDLASGQEGDRTGQVDGEPALHLVKDDAGDPFASVEGLFENGPGFFALGFVARKNRLAILVFDPLDIDLDRIACGDLRRFALVRELLQWHAAFGFQPDIDQNHVVIDANHAPFNDSSFEILRALERLFEKRGKTLLECGCRLLRVGGRFHVARRSFDRPTCGRGFRSTISLWHTTVRLHCRQCRSESRYIARQHQRLPRPICRWCP